MHRVTLLALSLVAALPATASAAPRDFAAAVTTPGRPSDAIALDASRRPAEVLDFLKVRGGTRVLDVLAGSGYYTEILARAVGPRGHVTAITATQSGKSPEAAAKWTALLARNPNVTRVPQSFEAVTPPLDRFDTTIIHLDYHDMYWENAKNGIVRQDPARFVRALYAAMKPGGIVGVADHVAVAGSDPRVSADTLHRIDPAIVRADFERAGFVLDATSPVLAVAEDDHSKNVFDPAIRGKTDRFLFRFRKPR
jgi:predicted methyltransferase